MDIRDGTVLYSPEAGNDQDRQWNHCTCLHKVWSNVQAFKQKTDLTTAPALIFNIVLRLIICWTLPAKVSQVKRIRDNKVRSFLPV